MQVTAYSMTVPVFVRALTNLSAILDKAADHCKNRAIDEHVLLDARLFPDMLPLVMQVRLATDFARAAARLAGGEPSKLEDNETSFAELKARIARAVADVEQLGEANFAQATERQIVRRVRGVDTTLDGYSYLAHFMLPNFFFHVTTAYDILRHNGLDIGKRDFIGAL